MASLELGLFRSQSVCELNDVKALSQKEVWDQGEIQRGLMQSLPSPPYLSDMGSHAWIQFISFSLK